MEEEQTQEAPEEEQEEKQERKDSGDREMHKATCSECGKECEVPFKPAEGRPVFCKDCYMKRRRRF